MAQNGLPTLHVDPNLLARELDTSLSLANRSPTGPDDEALLRDASKRLGIPLDTARSNPQETKRAVESSAVNLDDYARRFPSAARYLADPDNALVSRDDLGPLSEVEQILRDSARSGQMRDTMQGIMDAHRPEYAAEQRRIQQVLRTEGFAAASKMERQLREQYEAELARPQPQPQGPAPDRSLPGAIRRHYVATGVLGEFAAVGLDALLTRLGSAFLPEPKGGWEGVELRSGSARASLELAATTYNALPTEDRIEIAGKIVERAAEEDRLLGGIGDASVYLAQNPTAAINYLVEMTGVAIPGAVGGGLLARPLARRIAGEVAESTAESAARTTLAAQVARQNTLRGLAATGTVQAGVTGGGTFTGALALEFASRLDRNGGDIDEAAQYALKKASVEGAVNAPFGFAAGMIPVVGTPAWTHFVRRLEQAMVQGTGGAAGAGAASLSVGEAVSPGELFLEFFFEAATGPVDAAIGTLTNQDLLAKIDRQETAIADARTASERLRQLLAAAERSLTRQRTPATFSQLVQQAAEDGGTAPTELFIDARTLVEALEQSGMSREQLEQSLPSVAEQLEVALALETDLVVPIGEATTALAGTDLEQLLAQNARTREDGLSQAEAEAMDAELLQQLEVEAGKVLAEQSDKVAWENDAKQVFDTLTTELGNAGRFTPDVNRAYATLLRNFYATTASRLGTTPSELYGRFPLRVSSRTPGQQSQVLDQYASSVTPGAQPGALNIEGVHFSAGRREVLDGSFYGTGARGAERARLADLPAESPLRRRVYAYVDEGAGVRPEQGVGSTAHAVTLQNIYDTGRDPLGIWTGDANTREQAVLDAGFDGYYTPGSMAAGQGRTQGTVVTLGDAARAIPTREYTPGGVSAAQEQLSPERQALEDLYNDNQIPRGMMTPRQLGERVQRMRPDLYEILEPTGLFEGETEAYRADIIAAARDADVFNQASLEQQASALSQELTASGWQVQDTLTVDQLISSDRVPTLTLQSLVGMRIFPTIADRTAAAALYTGVDSSQVEIAIPLLGGPLFPLRESNADAGVVWANRGASVTGQKAAKLKAGANHMMIVMGDANMHQSNVTVNNAFFATLSAYVRDKRITKKNAEQLTRMVRQSSTADPQVNAYMESFPGLTDQAKLDAYLHRISFNARRRLLDLLGTKGAQALGAPSMTKILDATREPSLAGQRWGDGVLLVEVDQETPMVSLGEEGTQPHPDFPLGIRGKVVGKLEAPVNYELLWQDWLADARQGAIDSGTAPEKVNVRRAFELAKPAVEITEDLVARIGDIKQNNIDGPRQARLAADFATGYWRTSDLPVNRGGVSPQEFADAIQNSDAYATLTPYTAKELRSGIKDGTMRLFQLGKDGQIFFMLEKKGDGRVELASVVNNEQGARGIGAPAILLKALQEGATDLTAFAVTSEKYPTGFLPALYESFGFEVTNEFAFDPKYFRSDLPKKERDRVLADAVKYWTDSTPGFDPTTGMPSVVEMTWRGNDADRANITERYLRGGLEGLLARGADADVQAAEAELAALDQQTDQAEQGPADASGAAGDQGAGDRAPVASRAQRAVSGIADLNDSELQNLGLTAADRTAVQRALGRQAATQPGRQQEVGEVFNQEAVNPNAATPADFAPGAIQGLLTKDDWALLTAENPDGVQMSAEENAQRNAQLQADLEAMGATVTPVLGKYGNLENSFAVTGITEAQAVEMGRKYQQDSVLTKRGLLYRDGRITPATGEITEFTDAPADFFSEVPSTGARFAIELDFDATTQQAELTDPAADREIVVFDPTQIKSAIGNNGNFDPADPNILNQNTSARATFNPATLEISLLEKADLSSFLHETGHFFFEMLGTLAAEPDAPQALRDDMQMLLDHIGFKGTIEEWVTLSVNERREGHETIAESFEQYLFTGKAPTAPMQPLFRRFKSWLVSVYRGLQEFLAGNERASLTPEVSGVFDRLIATEEEIKAAQAVRDFQPLFEDQDGSGMTSEEWEAYQANIEQHQAEALEELQGRSLRDMKWLDNARGRKLRELQRDAAARRKALRDEITAEIEAEPVYAAMEFLKHGRLQADDEEIQIAENKAHKLNIDAVAALFPEGELGDNTAWKKLGYGKYGMLSNEGLPPDVVAEMFGFKSGRDLVTSILNAEPKAQAINGLTDQRMLERYGDLSSPAAMREAANEALANEARARMVATELKAVAKLTGSPSALARAARQAAEQIVAARRVRNLRPDLAAAAAQRARKAAEKAMAAGDTAGAAAAKRTEMLNVQLERAERNARAEHDKALRGFQKINKGTNEKIAKSRDVDLVNAARAVLARYGLAPRGAAINAQNYMELLSTYNGAMAEDLRSMLQGLPPTMDFRDMTVEQFNGMRDIVNGLYYLSKRTKQMEIDGEKVELDAVADEIVAGVLDRTGGELPPLPGYTSTTTRADEWKVGLLGAKASLMRVEAWANAMGAPFKKYIWQPVSEAITRAKVKRNDMVKQYLELLKGIEKGLTYDKINAPELGSAGFTFNAGKTELLHAVLHTGNQSNLKKLLLGRGWGTLREDGSLDTSRWDAFMARMYAEGTITQADMEFVQGVWDLLETIKADAQAAHKEMYGYYFSEITADPVVTPWGEYRGGYVPAIADTLSSPDAAQKREQEELLHAGNSFMFPTTGKGFTQSRVEYNRPLALDLRSIGMHLDKVARFAYIEPAVRDVGKLLTNRRVARALNGYDQGLISSMLNPWLQRSARQNVNSPGKNPKVDKFFNELRTRSGMVLMFGNIVNTMQQITGFSLAALKVPAHRLLRANMRYITNHFEVVENARTLSPWLADRMDNHSFEMMGQIDKILLDPNPIKRSAEYLRRNAYFMQQGVQNVMDIIVWTGAYDHAVAKGSSQKDAVRYADETVRMTQGSFAPEDVSAFEVQSPFVRLFTQFYGYFNMWGNLLGAEGSKALRDAGFVKASPRLLFLWFAGMAIPAVVAELIAAGAPDDEDDEDGDGLLDEWLAMFFGAQAKSVAAMVPVAGQVSVLASNYMDDKVYNDRLNISPAVSLLESAVYGGTSLVSGELFDEDPTKKELRSALILTGMAFGVPVGPLMRAGSFAIDEAEGRKEADNALEYGTGLLLGR